MSPVGPVSVPPVPSPTTSSNERPPDAEDPLDEGPLVPYILTPTEEAQLLYALDAMTAECLDGFGKGIGHKALSSYRRAAQDQRKYTLSWEYGLTNPNQGYRSRQPRMPVVEGEIDVFLHQGTTDPTGGGPPALETTSPGKVGGRVVPPGGCQGQAWRALDDEGGISWGSSSVDYWILAVDLTVQQPGYAKALAPWITCMASAGYHVTDPIDDNGDIAKAIERGSGQDSPYPEELELAWADARCKRETELIEKLTPLRRAAQQQVLDEHSVELTANRAMLNHKVSLARNWIAEHGDGPAK